MSATPRLYVEAALEAGGRLELDQAQSHYLARVMRLRIGDAVRVFNGRDGEFDAEVAEVGKPAVVLSLAERRRVQESSPDIWLLFAPVKKSATDLIVEKAVELGVSRIVPVRTRWANAPPVRADRLQRIIVEAAEQTERLDLPEVGSEVSLEDTLAGWDVGRVLFFCDEAGDEPEAPWGGRGVRAPDIASVIAREGAGPAAILIGPEGGFAPEERAALREYNFLLPVSLGPRVLRAETAVIAALSVWQSVAGDWPSKAPEN